VVLNQGKDRFLGIFGGLIKTPNNVAYSRSRKLGMLICHGKSMDIYKSKELWRGPGSIYILKQGLCVAHDIIPLIRIVIYPFQALSNEFYDLRTVYAGSPPKQRH
jgi:hypothetical protein